MAIQVRLFKEHTGRYYDLEESLNDFLSHINKEDLVDIKYTADSEHVHAMVVYNEP